MNLPLDAILVGDRVRKDMGDLKGLAESMERHGLLHPIVVKKDNTLVAGHRRIEAARLLGWPDIAVTVVDVEDLLSAERDENTERKDFTPTEAVAIGRLIEDVEKPLAAEAKRVGGRISLSKLYPDRGESPPSVARGGIRERVAAAVGMGAQKYDQAKAVVSAAEAEPESFGDLPAQMDETGNVLGAHREMERRRGPKAKGNGKHAPRHPYFKGTHYPKPNREAERAVWALDGLCIGLEMIAVDQLDPAKTKEWAEAFKKSAVIINRFARRLLNVKAARKVEAADQRTA